MIQKLLLFVIGAGILAGTLTAQAQNWTLSETKTYGAGGAWENGEKVRIDRSYRSGTFSFERKVSEGNTLDVYTSKGIFSALKKEYEPGETVSVDITVSGTGAAAAAPELTYGRVTLVPDAPAWSKASIIDGSGRREGQFTTADGNAIASPSAGETVKLSLSGIMPAEGSRVAIIFSCNGMDVVHTYTRDVMSPAPAPVQEETPAEEAAVDAEEEGMQVRDYPEPVPDALETVGFPLGKILMLAGLLILAVIDIIWMLRRPKK